MVKSKIRPLEDWLTIPETAEMIGRNRARVHQMVDENKFDTNQMRVIGNKHIILISETEVKAYMAIRDNKREQIEESLGLHAPTSNENIILETEFEKIYKELKKDVDKIPIGKVFAVRDISKNSW